MTDHGFSPLGKFDSARDSILSFLCLSDWANDSFGSMDYGTYTWRISNDAADVSLENREFNSILAEWLEFNPEVTDSPELRSELVGHFIVSEVTSGLVFVSQYGTEEECMYAYMVDNAQFNDWDEQENGED